MRLWRRLILPAMFLLCSIARGELQVSLSYSGPDLVVHPVESPFDVRFGDALTLQASVTDSTSPDVPVTTQNWSKVSGPGTVVFSAQTARKTQVSFSEPGSYALSITVTAGTVSQTASLEVIVNRYPTAGRYRGLLSQSTVPSGMVVANVAAGGSISASLQVGRQTFRFRPVLSGTGVWTGTVSNGISRLKVTLQTNAAGTLLTAAVNRGGVIDRATLSKTGLPTTGVPNGEYGGKHTFLLTVHSATTDGDSRGRGYGSIKIKSTGAVTMVGKTPDGVPFSVGSVVRPTGNFDVYVPLLGPADFLGGSLRFFDNSGAQTDVSGSLVWNAMQPFPVSLLLDLSGSAFRSYPTYLEPWTGKTQAISAQFSSGGQGRTVATQALTIQVGGQGVMSTPQTLDLSLRLNNSGVFFGTFRIPGRISKSDYIGAVLQRSKKGGGMLIGSKTLGWVELTQGGSAGQTGSN